MENNLMQTRMKSYVEHWATWRHGNANRKIFVAALTIAVITVSIKSVSVLKELVVAYHFGTSKTLDAYIIAFMLPAFVINILATSFNAAFIPTYIGVLENEGSAAAQRLFSNILAVSLCSFVLLSLLLAITGPYFLRPFAIGIDDEGAALTRAIFFILLPAIVISGITTLCGAVLNATERYAVVAATPVLGPILGMTGLILWSEYAVFALAVGTVLGLVIEAGILMWRLGTQGISLRIRWHGMDPAVRKVAGQYVPIVAGAALMTSTELIDQAMATWLGPGSVSSLTYGSRVTALFMGLATVALGTAVLPQLSRLVACRDLSGALRVSRVYAKIIAVATVPLTIAAIYVSEPLVRILFERGAFSAADVALVAEVQKCYLLQVPFYTLSIIGVRLLSALAMNHLLLKIALVNITANVIGNVLLMNLFGVAGIALSTSVVSIISFFLIARYVRQLATNGGTVQDKTGK